MCWAVYQINCMHKFTITFSICKYGYHPHFVDAKTETLRVYIICLGRFSMAITGMLTKGVRYGRQFSGPLKYTVFLYKMF